MSVPNINGHNLLSLELREPRTGLWVAKVEVDKADALTDPALTIDIDGIQWKGALVCGAVEGTRWHATVTGGSAKLTLEVGPKHYVNTSVQIMLGDILSETGDVASPTIEPSLLSKTLPRWSRPQGSCGAAIRQLADDLQAAFRVLRDGTVWLGTETWPELPNEPCVIPFEDHTHGRMLAAPDRAFLVPGWTYQQRRISLVVTQLTGSSLRQVVAFEQAPVQVVPAVEAAPAVQAATAAAPVQSAASKLDRQLAPVARVVESLVGRRIDLAQWYPSKVVQQLDDGSLELLPDDERIRGDGIGQVPLRHGLPGCTVKVKPGSRVCLFFEDNDAKKPAAGLWPTGEGVLGIELVTETSVTITSPTVRIDGELQVTGEVTAMHGKPTAVKVSKHKHPTGMGPSDMPLPGI